MFKKILAPLDGSPLAAKIIPQVIELAKAHQAEVTLLHVCYTEYGEASPGTMAAAAAQEAKACEAFLGQVAKDFAAQGIKVTVACVEGSPGREIISYAVANKMDLIAMATHGRGEVAWALGSVAAKVVTHASVPVLLFRVMEARLPDLKTEYPIP